MNRAGAQTLGRAAFATAAVAGMECSWLYVLLNALSQRMDLPISVPMLLLLYPVSFAVTLGVRAAVHSLRLTKVLSWVASPFATLLWLMILLYPGPPAKTGSWTAVLLRSLNGIVDEVGAALFIVVAAGLLWSLGVRLGTARTGYEMVVTEFQLGLIALAGSLFIGYLVGADQSAAVPIGVLYIGLGLLGAAALRVDDRGGRLFFARDGTWWAMLVVGVGLVLLLGLAAGIIFTPEFMHLVGRGIRGLWELTVRLLDAIAGLFSSSSTPEMQPPPSAEIPPPQEEGYSWSLPEWLLRPSRIVYAVFAGGLALVAIWRIASQFFDWVRRRAGRGGAELESLPGAFRTDLAGLFRRLLAWAGRLGTVILGLWRPRNRQPGPAASVRRLYADMLRWGARSGFPRRSSQTPLEYQRTLSAAFPAHTAEVTFITESYVRARYGGQSPTQAQLNELKESRRRLKHKARRTAKKPASRPVDKAKA